MKPGQEFDRIIRRKVEESESEFAFDENNWQKAAAMLDAERGAAGFRNNKKFLLAGALCLILGSVAFFGYKYSNFESGSAKQNLVVSPDKSHSDENISMNAARNDKNPVIENTGDNNLSGKVHETPMATVSREATDATHIADNTSSPSTVRSSKGMTTSHNATSHGSSMSHAGSVAKSKSVSNSKDETPAITSQYSSDSEKQAVEKSDGSNMYENLFLDKKVTKMPSHSLDADLRKTSYDFIRIYKDDFYTKKRKTRYLDVEAGTMYATGWDAKAGRDAAGFNAYAGVNFGFLVKKKVSASIGVQVYNIGNVKQPFYTGSSINYGFGANGTYTAITTNNLAYAAIPVKINYAFDKRNTVGAGVNVAMLFNGMNTVETYSMEDGVKTNVKRASTSGYYEGANTRNIMLTAFYSRAVNRRMKVNAEVMYGISDIYSSKITGTSTKEKCTGIRLGIQYTLFSK